MTRTDGLAQLAGMLAPTAQVAVQRPELRVEPATIAAVTAAGGTDGQPLLTLTWRGASVDAAHVATPGMTAYGASDVGSVVAVLLVGGVPLVLGPIQGTPPDPSGA